MSPEHINSIRADLGSAETVSVGTVEKLGDPILVEFEKNMSLSRVRVVKVYKGNLSSHVNVHLHPYNFDLPSDRVSAVFYASRETSEMMIGHVGSKISSLWVPMRNWQRRSCGLREFASAFTFGSHQKKASYTSARSSD